MNNNGSSAVTFLVDHQGDVLVLRLSGRLDALSSSDAEKKVFEYIYTGRNKIILDFNGVDYLSSAGMRMLLSVSKKVKSLSGQFVIFGVIPVVMDILKMAGFDHVLNIVSSQEEALRKF